jgi:hypothetical protein
MVVQLQLREDQMRVLIKLIENLQTAGGVAGTLAILIAVTLCAIYFSNPAANPDIGKTLIYAFTTIIGFYFGTASASKGKDRSHSNNVGGANGPSTVPQPRVPQIPVGS